MAVIIGAASWEVYWNYIYQAPPVYAEIGTTYGPIYVELFASCAPKTVSNFVGLAKSDFYNDLVWWRIVPGFVIQTGDPNTKGGVNSTRSTWGTGGSNETVPLEVTKCPSLGNYAGYLGMARQGNETSGLNTGTSQFYIVLDNSSTTESDLDGYYTVFGKVISGMSVVCTIAKVPTYPDTGTSASLSPQPITPVFMNNVTIVSKATAPTPQPITNC